jgi:hypothetical protein
LPLPDRSLPGFARRSYGKTTAIRVSPVRPRPRLEPSHKNLSGYVIRRAICRADPSTNTQRSRAGKNRPSCTRTKALLIQRAPVTARSRQPAAITRVRVTRCRSLPAFMPDFAVLYSLKCRSCRVDQHLPTLRAGPLAAPSCAVQEFLLRPAEPQVELKGAGSPSLQRTSSGGEGARSSW